MLDIIKEQVYNALFADRMSSAFPDMEFKKVYGRKWASGKHLDGQPSSKGSKDQTYIGREKPHLISDNGGETISLIDFEMRRTGADFFTALKRLASVCDIEIPQGDSDEFNRKQEEYKRREVINRAYTSALWNGTPGADEVLNYLRRVRKFTDEEIKRAEFGYIDEAGFAIFEGDERKQYVVSMKDTNESVGTTHRLVIPYRNGSRLFGFKYRRIDDSATGRKYLNSFGLSKSAGMFGVPVGCKDLVVVEGEIDAIHAKVKGFANVCAITGKSVGEEQAKDAIRRGVTRFTLLLDNPKDENDESEIKDLRKAKETSIRNLQNNGVSVFVAELPKYVKDTDEFLCNASVEEWERCINETAVPASVWKAQQHVNDALNIVARNGGITLKEREDLFLTIEGVLNDPYTKVQDRKFVFDLLKTHETGLNFSADEFKAWADKDYNRKQAKKTRDEVLAGLNRINDLATAEDIDAVLKECRKLAEVQGARDEELEFAELFAYESYDDVCKLLAKTPEGIPTGITFERVGKEPEKLTLEAGLTFVCAYSGHGKTSFLNCIALNEAKRNIAHDTGKSVLYFSYEMDKSRVVADLLNTFTDDEGISENPLKSIQSHFRQGGFGYFKFPNTEEGKRHIEHFRRCKDEFLRRYINGRKLIVVESNYTVEKLLRAIKFYVAKNPVSLICIDYAQLLNSEERANLRTEEIKGIVKKIKDYANASGIPVLLACQFNREVDSPVDVDYKCIGESGEFEKIADTCIGLFNLKALRPLPKNSKAEEATKKLLVDLNLINPNDDLKPIYDKMFVRLMKRRFGEWPLDTVLKWCGKTKKIYPNAPKELDLTPQQLNLNI